ncbi:MAG: GntP family permease [Bacteroidota bacterium]
MLAGLPLIFTILVAIVFVVISCSRWRWHPFLALLMASIGLGLVSGIDPLSVAEHLKLGFGGILAAIGIIVVVGAIIGVALEKSGAAIRLAQLILRLVGPKRPALAMTLVGALVSIPVFCDTGFIILSRLNKAIAAKSGVAPATLTLALAGGLYTTHTLVPPTPGPLAAADLLGASDYIGTIMLMGLLFSIPCLLVVWQFARLRGPKLTVAELEGVVQAEDNRELPGNWASILPILLPILLIAMGTLLKFLALEGTAVAWLQLLGQPVVALLLGLLCCLPLFRYGKDRTTESGDSQRFADWVGEGIQLSGPILVLTGAGGAFGAILKATALKTTIEGWLGETSLGGFSLLLLAFGLAALLKTAQGSSTNAIQITAALVASLAALAGFDSPLEFSLLIGAIGAGAMTVSHANDSYFWVVSKFSGLDLRESYSSYTPMTGLQGLSVLATVLLVYCVINLL